MKRRCCTAFTLLEVLIVVAIMAVVAALALPTMEGFRKRSRNVECIQNLRKLGMGISLFINDHNGRFPPTFEEQTPRPTFGNDVPAFGPTWAEFIVARYLDKDKTVLRCPSRPSTWAPKGYVGYYPEYGLNERLCPIDPASGNRVGIRFASLAQPAKLIILADVARFSGGKPVGGYYRIYGAADLHPRHLDSHVNVLYADQHIETHRHDRNGPAPASDAPLGTGAFTLSFN